MHDMHMYMHMYNSCICIEWQGEVPCGVLVSVCLCRATKEVREVAQTCKHTTKAQRKKEEMQPSGEEKLNEQLLAELSPEERGSERHRTPKGTWKHF